MTDLQRALDAARVSPEEFKDAVAAGRGNDPHPLVLEYELRLHHTGLNPGQTPDEVGWDATVVGEPCPFAAVVIPEAGLWMAVTQAAVTTPEDLAWPFWSVQRPGTAGLPTMHGPVGHFMKSGDAFFKPVIYSWTAGVTTP